MESISNSHQTGLTKTNQSIIVKQNIKMKLTISDCYSQARTAFAMGNEDQARDLADMGIVKVAQAREEGAGIDDIIDDVRVGLWLERFWYFLENNNLLHD